MYADFEPFFGSLVRACVEFENFYSVVQAMGIRAQVWPRMAAREIMLQFESFAEKRGDRSAAILVRNSSMDLPCLDREIDEAFLASHYHGYLQTGLGIQLGQKILGNPQLAQKYIREFSEGTLGGGAVEHVDIRTTIDDFLGKVQKSREDNSDVTLIPGFHETSTAIGGFNPKRIVLITAKTGVGKTNLSLNLAYRSSEVRPTLFINMEMDLYDLNVRLFQHITGNPRWQIFNSSKENFKVMSTLYASKIQNRHDLIFTEGRSLSLFQIKFLIRKLSKEKGIKQVFIDYDQKITVDDPREEWKTLQVAAESLEEIAKECDLNIVWLSQGDDVGDPKASKRIKQSASSVLHFYEESGVFVLEAIKNRFGRYGAKIYFEYEADKSTCTELAEVFAKERIKQQRSINATTF